MRTNIVDVAKKARVSTITVSRAFSNPALLAPETRDRVMQAAEQLGYTPNRLARSLRNGKTQTVAVLTTDVQQWLSTLKLDRLQREIARQGYRTLLLQYGCAEHQAFSLLSECRDGIDGLVLCCLEGGPPVQEIRALMHRGIPVVSMEYCTGLSIDVVTADREFGAHLAVEHMLSLGHTQIALAQTALQSEVTGRRALGYQSAMSAAGQEPIIVSRAGGGNSNCEDGYLLMQEAHASGIRPTAWIFPDDELAVGAMKAFREWGWRVPKDVAVIGWDNSPLGEYVCPQLTSITQPVQESVQRLVARLLEKMAGVPSAPEVTLIHPELIVRESCGARQARVS